MDHQIVQYFFRHQRQLPVKIQISLRAAAAPPGLLLPHCDRPVGNAHALCKIPAFLQKQLLCQPLPGFPFPVCIHGPRRGSFPAFQDPLPDPVHMGLYKAVRLLRADSIGDPDRHRPVFGHLKGHGLSLCPDQPVGNVFRFSLLDLFHRILQNFCNIHPSHTIYSITIDGFTQADSYIFEQKKDRLLTQPVFRAPEKIRTPDTTVRSRMLYPAELLTPIGGSVSFTHSTE